MSDDLKRSQLAHPRAEALAPPVEIVVQQGAVTRGAGVWRQKDYDDWIMAIERATREHPRRHELAGWIVNKRNHLAIEVTFYVRRDADIDNLFAPVLNPLVTGACGPRPSLPERRDSRFWIALLQKISTGRKEHIKIVVYPVPARTAKEATDD